MGWFDGFDHYVLTEELDMASWDNYVGKGHLDYAGNGMVHDLTRGFKRKNYWVMETQPGSVNWADINNSLDKGEVREMAWQAIGHGSDAVSYWQWRSALGGQEQIHGTLVAPDGLPVPLYNEVKQIGAEFAKAADVLRGTQPVSQVALLHDYDSRWAIQFQKHHKDYDTFAQFRSWYRPVKNAFQNVDVVNPNAPLNGYKIVLAPQLNVLPDALAQKLVDYVKQGGHLVLGPRSGQKDEFNALHPARQPGRALIDLLGGQVEQYYALLDPVPVEGEAGKGEAKIWAERLQILGPDTQPFMYYGKSNGWLDSQPAVITRVVGKGRISYIGAWLDDSTMDVLIGAAMQDRTMSPLIAGVPKDVEVCQRSSGERKVYIIINHGAQTKEVVLPKAMKDVLKGGMTDRVQLASRDVAVVSE
jgi:beta-galactosidase